MFFIYVFLGFQSNCVDVKSQRDQKSSNGNGRKSGKFSKRVPPWHNNRKQQMLSRRASANGGFEQAKGTLQEVTQDESIRLLLILILMSGALNRKLFLLRYQIFEYYFLSLTFPISLSDFYLITLYL